MYVSDISPTGANVVWENSDAPDTRGLIPLIRNSNLYAIGKPGNALVIAAPLEYQDPLSIARNATHVVTLDGPRPAVTLFKQERDNVTLEAMRSERVFENRYLHVELHRIPENILDGLVRTRKTSRYIVLEDLIQKVQRHSRSR